MNKALLSALSLTVALAFAAPLGLVTSASAASTTAAATTTTAPAKPMVKKHKAHRKHASAKTTKKHTASKVMKKKTDQDQKKS
jgi:hypothetical protein